MEEYQKKLYNWLANSTSISKPRTIDDMMSPMTTTTNSIGNSDDINNDLRAQIFSYGETVAINNARSYIESQLPDWIKHNSDIVVAGGCFASRMQSTLVKDIDVFILDAPATRIEEIKEKMLNQYPDIDDKTDTYARNNNAVDEVWTDSHKKVQFIFTNHKTRQNLINDFDYVHCMTSYQLGKLYITRRIFDAIQNMQLVVNNDKNVQEWRRSKFLTRGYKEIAPAPESTLGDILSSALRAASKPVSGGGKTKMANMTVWTDWEDVADEWNNHRAQSEHDREVARMADILMKKVTSNTPWQD